MSGDQPVDAPARVRANTLPSADELRTLGRECIDCRVSDKSKLLMARLASLPPTVRLIVNFKSLLAQMATGPIFNVLTEGLAPQERAALVELDVRGLSVQSREVAHGLLNVHERWIMMKPLRACFKKAINVADGFLLPKEELIDPTHTSNT